MDINDVRAGYTLVMFMIFLGIFIWAYSRKRKDDFHEAERLALDDPDFPKSEVKQEDEQ